jgi:dTDP-glucose pyrophosphorylase
MIMHLIAEKYLDDVLMALMEAGIENTLVVSGENMSHKLTYDMPIFAGFRNISGGNGYGKMIMGIAKKKQIDFALEELHNSGIDLVKSNYAEIAILPVEHIYRGDE